MTRWHNKLTYNPLIFLVSASFSFYLAQLPVDAFYDRVNYLMYASSSSLVFLRYLNEGLLSVLLNEPVWLGLNILLSTVFNEEITLRALVFFSSFVLTYKVLKYKPKYFILLCLFLLLPQVLKNNIVHLRQGVGLAFFLLGYFSKHKVSKAVFILISPFVHTSFIFIVFFYLVNKVYHHLRFAADVRALTIVLFGLFVSILGIKLAGLLGARQGDESGLYASAGMHALGFGSVFWSVILCLYFSAGKSFLKEQSLSVSILVFYLSTYLFFPVTARIFESGLILVLLSGLSLRGFKFYSFIILFSFYFIMQWAVRLNEPLFGWAVPL